MAIWEGQVKGRVSEGRLHYQPGQQLAPLKPVPAFNKKKPRHKRRDLLRYLVKPSSPHPEQIEPGPPKKMASSKAWLRQAYINFYSEKC